MLRDLKHIIFSIMTVLLVAPAAGAQVYRVAIASNASRTDYVDVYEYDFVDVQPQFPGGDRGLINYIIKTRVYPNDAYQHKIQGRVICSFIVNTDGSICNITVLKGLCPSIDEEAKRIIQEMPNWKAGKLNDETVPVHCILPIAFRL